VGLRKFKKGHVMNGDDSFFRKAQQWKRIVQGMNHVDSVPQRKRWYEYLFQKKSKEQDSENAAGKSDQSHARPVQVVEGGLIALNDHHVTMGDVEIGDGADQVHCVNTDTGFIEWYLTGINQNFHCRR
jgi:hypothetical protein